MAKKPKGKKPAGAMPTNPNVPDYKPKKGRPTSYTEELGAQICDLLADGKTLIEICRAEDMPVERTVRRWAMDPNHPFSPNYARAREVGYHKMSDEMLIIPRMPGIDPSIAKIMVDTRKWLLSKALPKLYGDRVALTDADGGNTIQVKFVV